MRAMGAAKGTLRTGIITSKHNQTSQNTNSTAPTANNGLAALGTSVSGSVLSGVHSSTPNASVNTAGDAYQQVNPFVA
jgi:hypothetical protein